MLSQLFDSICKKAEQAKAPTVTRIPNTRKILCETEKGLELLDVENDRPHPISGSVGSLPDLIDAITRYRPQVLETRKDWKLESEFKQSSIWIGDDAVVGFIDDLIRADCVRMPLTFTPQFAACNGLDREFSQPDLIKFLRVALDGTDANLAIPAFRDLQWDRSSTAKGKAQHMDESLGRSVENRVVSGQDVPEMIKVLVPVYSNRGLTLRHPLSILVSMNFARESIQLTVSPGDALDAIQAAQDFIRNRLDDLLGDSDGSVFVSSGSFTD